MFEKLNDINIKQNFFFCLKLFFRLIITSDYAFGDKGNEEFKIPPKATVEYTVTLNEFEREPEAWKLSPKESLEQAKIVKDKATLVLMQERYELAIKIFEKAHSYLTSITSKCVVKCCLSASHHHRHFYLLLN